MSNREKNPGSDLSKREMLGILLWTCLGLAVPVGLIATQDKLGDPWGTITVLLLLSAFVCAVLRCFSPKKPQ
jgi:hypothetical protein